MPKKPECCPVVCLVEVVVPCSNAGQTNISKEVQKKVKSFYKNRYGGCSSNVTKSYKAQEFVDKCSGHNVGYKQEAKYSYNSKHVDKQQGVTTEYKAQLRVTKSVHHKNSASAKSNNKYITYHY